MWIALGVQEPISGPRAVLDGRVGTVIDVGYEFGQDGKEKIQVRCNVPVRQPDAP